MMALVDYRGFRVVGMTLLPITGDTLLHGSRDAGATIKTHSFFDDKFRKIALKLNLKAHRVGTEGHIFYTPIDLEGHQGTDGKYYTVDFSRLFPPQSLSPNHRLGNLYQLFRPEFVRTYPKPLCSDAFSTFTCPQGCNDPVREEEAIQHDQEIDQATQYLLENLVPAFAKRLVSEPAERRAAFQLILLMHSSGINVRYIGALHEALAKNEAGDYWRLRLVVEMAARVVKNDVRALLRRKMREHLLPGEGAYRSVIIAHMNLVFGNSPSTSRHWATNIVPKMAEKFPPFTYSGRQCLLMRISQAALLMGLPDGRYILLKEIARMLGLRFASTTWLEVSSNPRAFDRYQPFTDTDLKEMKEKLKEMNIASHSAGFMLKVKAKLTSNPEERRRLLSLAVQQFEHALEGNPDNKVTLRNLGECLTGLDKFVEAQDCYLRALQVGFNDTTTLYKYAIALDKAGHLDESEEYFLRSLEACPWHSNCCYYYADFLCYHRKNFEAAERFYQRSLEIDPGNRTAANNYAVFLTTVRRDHDRADHFFQLALAHGSNASHISNYASFLLHIRNNPDSAAVYMAKAHKLRVSSKWT